jgi:hypothetical protein
VGCDLDTNPTPQEFGGIIQQLKNFNLRVGKRNVTITEVIVVVVVVVECCCFLIIIIVDVRVPRPFHIAAEAVRFSKKHLYASAV